MNWNSGSMTRPQSRSATPAGVVLGPSTSSATRHSFCVGPRPSVCRYRSSTQMIRLFCESAILAAARSIAFESVAPFVSSSAWSVVAVLLRLVMTISRLGRSSATCNGSAARSEARLWPGKAAVLHAGRKAGPSATGMLAKSFRRIGARPGPSSTGVTPSASGCAAAHSLSESAGLDQTPSGARRTRQVSSESNSVRFPPISHAA